MSDRFTVTHDHIKLLRAAYVGWNDCEYGAPAIDCKRPYGNSDVEADMAGILGYPLDDEDLDDVRSRLRVLHGETKTVLQIVLRTGHMEPGEYVRSSSWSADWTLGMTPLLAKLGHGSGAAHLAWPDAFALVAAMACSTVIIVVLIVLTARQGAKR